MLMRLAAESARCGVIGDVGVEGMDNEAVDVLEVR